jgi:hypothetical protein
VADRKKWKDIFRQAKAHIWFLVLMEEEEEEEEIQPFWGVFQELRNFTVSRTTLKLQLFVNLSQFSIQPSIELDFKCQMQFKGFC